MSPTRIEIRRIVALAGPVVVTQVGLMLLTVVDTMMLGHYGTTELDASALGRLWVIGTLVAGMGVVLGIDPLVSQAFGAGRGDRAGLALQRGVVVALAVSLPIGASWFWTERVLEWMGQDPWLAHEAQAYNVLQLPGLPCVLVFVALRQYLQARGLVAPALWIVLVGNVVNALANWALIFGEFGAPRLGLRGAALSTTLTQVAMVAGLVALVRLRRLHVGAWSGWSREALEWVGLRRVLRLGAPVAAMLLLENWAFYITALFAGTLGHIPLAAHIVAINLASLAFMVPLGISMGTATRVGNLIGAGDGPGAERCAWVGLGFGAAVMTVSAVAFLRLRDVLPRLYTEDAEVIALAAVALPIAAAFQLFDGVQVVGAGVLRGMGRAVPTAVLNLVGHYGLALPCAWYFGLHRGSGLSGIWWGQTVGLAVVAVGVLTWITWRGPRHAQRLEP